MKQSVFGILSLLFLMLSCNKPKVRNKHGEIQKTNSKQVRDYTPFIKKFLTDSATQLSSIKFPLKNVIQEEDRDIVKFIKFGEWKYTNFKKKKDWLISCQLINKNMFKTLVQIEDTGVYVTYSFEYKNGKWWLTLIEDAST